MVDSLGRVVFAVVLNDPSEFAWERLREIAEEHHFVLTERIAFIAVPANVVTGDLSDQIGMNKTNTVSGIVMRLGSYNGWNKRTLWEWLSLYDE